MAIKGSQINRSAGAAAGAEDVEPGRAGEQRGAERWGPKHVAIGREPSVPAIDHGLRFGAGRLVGRNLAAPALMCGPRVRTPI